MIPPMLLSAFLLLLLLLHFSVSTVDSTAHWHNHLHGSFVQCLSHNSPVSTIQSLTFTSANPSYSSVLNFSIQNLRFASPSTPKPRVIFTPVSESQIRDAILCAKKLGLEFRVRSGGHDFEGQSYVAGAPFVLVDILNLRSINIDVESATAWVEAGASQGEVYYNIAKKSRKFGFPGGAIPSLGVGGLISGGGFGMLARKYGVAADVVIDARFMDSNGDIFDRESMGEDLFWAIRGGGGGNFGVVLAWKIKLVAVPDTVTVFTIKKTLAQNLTNLAHRWQTVGPRFHEDLFMRIRFRRVNSTRGVGENSTTVQGNFQSLFLGRSDKLLSMIQESFPELGVTKDDCTEMTWVESILYFQGSSNVSALDSLLNRQTPIKIYLKAKSDYVKKPMPKKGIEGLLGLLYEQKPGLGDIVWSPFGGKMAEISESEIPYPHRAGNLYEIYEAVYWMEEGDTESQKPFPWINKLYTYLTPYVSKNPREAYVNHKDLDLGTTHKQTSPEEAREWGVQYFKKNFERLVRVKTRADPSNFFRNEQSIPPFLTSKC